VTHVSSPCQSWAAWGTESWVSH